MNVCAVQNFVFVKSKNPDPTRLTNSLKAVATVFGVCSPHQSQAIWQLRISSGSVLAVTRDEDGNILRSVRGQRPPQESENRFPRKAGPGNNQQRKRSSNVNDSIPRLKDDLKKKCRLFGLDTSGTRKDLTSRIEQHLNRESNNADNGEGEGERLYI